MQLEGKVYKVGQPQKITETFSKREFVIETSDERYPQKIMFEMHNDRGDILDHVEAGRMVRVKFDIRGREWADRENNRLRFFNTLAAWAVEFIDNEHGMGPATGNTAAGNTTTGAPVAGQQFEPLPAGDPIPDNDLPF